MAITIKTGKPRKGVPVMDENTSRSLADANQKLRILEERYLNLSKKFQITDENLIVSNKRVTDEVRALGKDMTEIKNTFADIDTKLRLMSDELTMCARKSDIAYIKRYVELWQPLNFVTKKEAEKIIAEYKESLQK